MGEIIIAGLGPGPFGLITVETLEVMKNAGMLLLRTAKHPAVSEITVRNISFISYDFLNDGDPKADQKIAEDCISRAAGGGSVVYAVPGSPLAGGETVAFIRQLAEEKKIPLRILPAVNTLDMPAEQPQFTLEPLVDVMTRLRSPGGCVWDREQNHSSLRRYIVEEVYEVLEAIDLKAGDKLCEELGDLLLQIVFHARVAEECGEFTMQDVVNEVTQKLIRRHPHVFGDITVRDAAEVLVNWEQIKKREKGNADRKSVLDGISPGLPALMRAYKLQNKAAKVGFDWDDIEPVWGKIEEELRELKTAVQDKDKTAAEGELGDVLFSMANLARFLGLEPEVALNVTNNKFVSRFTYIEKQVQSQGLSWDKLSLADLDILWEQAKLRENVKKSSDFR
ncbi:MAG: nucleoside triphosphate pyrophosphohydrolase [Veillonellales bacterium]